MLQQGTGPGAAANPLPDHRAALAAADAEEEQLARPPLISWEVGQVGPALARLNVWAQFEQGDDDLAKLACSSSQVSSLSPEVLLITLNRTSLQNDQHSTAAALIAAVAFGLSDVHIGSKRCHTVATIFLGILQHESQPLCPFFIPALPLIPYQSLQQAVQHHCTDCALILLAHPPSLGPQDQLSMFSWASSLGSKQHAAWAAFSGMMASAVDCQSAGLCLPGSPANLPG